MEHHKCLPTMLAEKTASYAMFTTEEQPLLTGSDDDIEDLSILIVAWSWIGEVGRRGVGRSHQILACRFYDL